MSIEDVETEKVRAMLTAPENRRNFLDYSSGITSLLATGSVHLGTRVPWERVPPTQSLRRLQ